MKETREQVAMGSATRATLRILTTAKNPRTVLGQMRPTGVAYHAARVAIEAYREVMEAADD